MAIRDCDDFSFAHRTAREQSELAILSASLIHSSSFCLSPNVSDKRARLDMQRRTAFLAIGVYEFA
jgi:hypothetical protein